MKQLNRVPAQEIPGDELQRAARPAAVSAALLQSLLGLLALPPDLLDLLLQRPPLSVALLQVSPQGVHLLQGRVQTAPQVLGKAGTWIQSKLNSSGLTEEDFYHIGSELVQKLLVLPDACYCCIHVQTAMFYDFTASCLCISVSMALVCLHFISPSLSFSLM